MLSEASYMFSEASYMLLLALNMLSLASDMLLLALFKLWREAEMVVFPSGSCKFQFSG
jgi:hypothetical protein